jgi:hypothetical protein
MPDIRHAITVDAPSDRVSQLVSSADGLAMWWAEDVVKVPGSAAIELGFFDRSTVYRLVRKPVPQEIRWACETGQEWAGTELVFRLQPKGEQTLLEFSHERWADASPYFVSCNTVWGHLMFKLKDAAERGGSPRPLFTRTGMESSAARAY